MQKASIDELIRSAGAAPPAPTAFLLCETAFLANETASHLRRAGVARIVAIGPGVDALEDAEDLMSAPARISQAEERAQCINRLIAGFAGGWRLIVFNGEFPFHPFHESRSLRDFTEFLSYERRPAVTAYGVDIYSDALGRDEADFTLDNVHFDTAGWYGFEREGRLAEVFGGLGWRLFFHGDTGRGLGAAHQTGWTALVATHLEGQAEG
ncbi:MAG: hypothetical protein AAF401_16545 [Pseudomonadota bacterium]